MSWDVYLIRTKNNTEPYDKIEDEQESGFEEWKSFAEKVVNFMATRNDEGK